MTAKSSLESVEARRKWHSTVLKQQAHIFKVPMGHFVKIDHILGHKTNFNTFK